MNCARESFCKKKRNLYGSFGKSRLSSSVDENVEKKIKNKQVPRRQRFQNGIPVVEYKRGFSILILNIKINTL